jgi:hypothetical protein
MRVLVCGGRDYLGEEAWRRVARELDELHQSCGFKVMTIIQGGSTGADEHARFWAELYEARLITERADWRKYGKAAGPTRNQRMIDKHRPDVVLAFPGGRGTADMVRRAKAAGVRVIDVGARE